MNKKIVFVNSLANLNIEHLGRGWNDYMTPELLRDFLGSKGIDSEFINLNELFIKTFFSDKFKNEFFQNLKKDVVDFEKKEKLNNEELTTYLSLKFLIERVEKLEPRSILDAVDGVIENLPSFSVLMMNDVDIIQSGKIKIYCDDADFQKKVSNFRRVMHAVLEKLDFNNSLLVFSIPARAQFNSLIQTGKLIKEMFPTAKIVIGGSYIKVVSLNMLDDMVKEKIIDFHIKDANEGKLLALAKEFLSGNLGDFRGDYKTCERVSINDIRKTRKSELPKKSKLLKCDVARQRLVLSKGCYWGKCRFCEFPITNRLFMIKSVDVMVDEIEFFYKQGVTDFSLITDCLIPSVGFNIAKEIIRRKLKIRWDSGFIRIDPGYTKEVFLLLKESGFDFSYVSVGMESSIDAVLTKINKGYDKKTINNFVNAAREAGVVFLRFNIIYDLPGTTLKESNEMKKFALELYDVSHGVGGGELYLSENSELGLHPENFGIKVIGEDNKTKAKDSILFTIDNDISAEEKNNISKFYANLNALFSAFLNYRNLDAGVLARTKMYTEKDFRLLIKTGSEFIRTNSLFNENGEKEQTSANVSVTSDLLNPGEFFVLKDFDKLKPDTWYSVGDIVKSIGYSSELERLRLLQKIFFGIIGILGWNGFADVKVEYLTKKV